MSTSSCQLSPPLLKRCNAVDESEPLKKGRKYSDKAASSKVTNNNGGVRYAIPDNFFIVSSEEESRKGKGVKCVRPVFVNNPGFGNLIDVRFFLPLMDLSRTEFLRNEKGEILVKPTRGMSFAVQEADKLIEGIKQVTEYLKNMN